MQGLSFYILLLIVFVIGSILGWIAFFSLGGLSKRIETLELQLKQLRELSSEQQSQKAPQSAQNSQAYQVSNKASDGDEQSATPTTSDIALNQAATKPDDQVQIANPALTIDSTVEPDTKTDQIKFTAFHDINSAQHIDHNEYVIEQANKQSETSELASFAAQEADAQAEPVTQPAADDAKRPKSYLISFADRLKAQWMVWLGGLCLALGGIFLAKYSIENNLISPAMRILAALGVGVIMHVAALKWRQRAGDGYASIAALAGGGSITLYAALLVALKLYALWSAGLIYAAMVLVSIATMYLALIHGPLLAAIGIVGAFAVPLFIDTQPSYALGVLVYSAIISLSGFLLMRWVYRVWLFWGVLTGAVLWFGVYKLSIWSTSTQVDWSALYLGVIALMAYYLLGSPEDNPDQVSYKVSQNQDDNKETLLIKDFNAYLELLGNKLIRSKLGIVLVLLSAIQSFFIFTQPIWGAESLFYLASFGLFLFIASRQALRLEISWLIVLSHAIAYGLLSNADNFSVSVSLQTNGWFYLVLAGLAAGGVIAGWVSYQRDKRSHLAGALCALSPVIFLTITVLYHPNWLGDRLVATCYVAIGLFYVLAAQHFFTRGESNESKSMLGFWCLLGGHALYSLAVVLAFEQAELSLAIALQVLSLVWFSRRYQVEQIDYLIKFVVVVLVIRLTFNPELSRYPVDQHWSLWTYGGSFAIVSLATYLSDSNKSLRAWLLGASLHFLTLFIIAEMRYWIHGGDIFAEQYSDIESALNTTIFAVLATVYAYRAKTANLTQIIYRYASNALMVLALLNFAFVFLAQNPLWTVVGENAQQNWLWFHVAFGLSAVAWIGVVRVNDEPSQRQFFITLALVSLWFYLNCLVRAYWQSENILLTNPTSNAELYSYSVLWLVFAIGAYIMGLVYQHGFTYKVGLGLLAVAICKIFLIDMANLEGLYRVLSFMGLGLSLLILGFIHQKIRERLQTSSIDQRALEK